MRKRKHPLLFFILCFCILISLSGCGSFTNTQPISRTDFAFDTVITITVYDRKDLPAQEACFTLAKHFEALFSRTLPESDVARINAAKGKPVTVSRETIELLSIALSYAELSKGAFDPTIGALSSLWDFTSGKKELPSEEAIQGAVKSVDYRKVSIDPDALRVSLQDPDARLDLGGIAKGYIADRMKEELQKYGVKHAIINLGGNVLVLGNRKGGGDYRIGIQKPFAEEGTPITELPLSDGSLVSSGIYERYFEKDGMIYHHILDTKTGYPIRNNLLSVTIRSKKSVDGDALSTICLALGLEEGLSLIETLPDTEAVFITDDYQLHATSGLNLP